MTIQQESRGFTLKNAIGIIAESISFLWKPAFVAAPLIGTALFFASGTHAQTSGSATPTVTTTANGPVAPIAAPEAARTGRPKIKTKTASDTSRVASPPTTTAPVTAPIAPIASPEAARTGRPKERDKTPMDTGRAANPTPAADPVAQPSERRRRGPKVRDDSVSDTSRTGRPKERDPTPHNRTGGGSATSPSRGSNLLLPALGGAAAIAAIVAATSGNDRPTSP